MSLNLSYQILSSRKKADQDTRIEVLVTDESPHEYASGIIFEIMKLLYPPTRVGGGLDSTEKLQKIGKRKYLFTQVTPWTD